MTSRSQAPEASAPVNSATGLKPDKADGRVSSCLVPDIVKPPEPDVVERHHRNCSIYGHVGLAMGTVRSRCGARDAL